MSKIRISIFGIALLACLALSSSQAVQSRTPQRKMTGEVPIYYMGTLVGSVKNIANGRPVTQGTITVTGQRTVNVDGSGKYKIERLPRGTYTVTFKESEYGEVHKRVTIRPNSTTTIDFKVAPLKAPRPTR